MIDELEVIDPEFAFYGPMGFDLGALIGNLLLAYCAVPGNGQGKAYGEWLLEQVGGQHDVMTEAMKRRIHSPGRCF